MHQVLRGNDDGVSRRGGGHCKGVGEKFHCPCDAFLASARHKDVVAEVVLQCCANVPAVDAVWRPGTVFCRRFVQESFGSGGSKRRFVIIEGSIEERFVRETGIDPQGEKKIESGGGK